MSQIDLSGDAYLWWDEAAGRYRRTRRPEIGSVIVFRKTSRLTDGHVGVVVGILSARRILIDQANWIPYHITFNQLVIDVSPHNEWQAVRVWYPPDHQMGITTFPTAGFILPSEPTTKAELKRRLASFLR